MSKDKKKKQTFGSMSPVKDFMANEPKTPPKRTKSPNPIQPIRDLFKPMKLPEQIPMEIPVTVETQKVYLFKYRGNDFAIIPKGDNRKTRMLWWEPNNKGMPYESRHSIQFEDGVPVSIKIYEARDVDECHKQFRHISPPPAYDCTLINFKIKDAKVFVGTGTKVPLLRKQAKEKE